MSDIWKFSASSEPAMQRCVSMAGPRDVRNKWLQEFKQKHCESDFGKSLYKLLKGTQESLDAKEDEERNKKEKVKLENSHDDFYETVDAEPVARFDFMLEEGSKNNALFKILAERISSASAEKICKLLFESDGLNQQYVSSFYRHFFPVYLKRPYTWFSLDILVKAHKAHPSHFCVLIQILLQDPEISNTMINDYVVTLDCAGCTEFLTTVMELELSDVEFGYNLISIYSAYKGCEKTERIQSYICNSLVQYNNHCVSDWLYGRLLLAFLHAANDADMNIDFMLFERVIEMHRSPFKRPCMTVLSAMIERQNADVLQNPT